MRFLFEVMFVALLGLAALPSVRGDTIDGRVTQVHLPAEDITLYYIEAKGAFTVKLETKHATVEGQTLYVGDGRVAVELIAHATDGIFLQGTNLRQGDQFRKGSTLKVRPGYKKASDLAPGSVYVILPGVTFELPGK